ncbi:hypothetical protein GCM10027517_33510 [Phycicoccus ginsengisoli]
MSDDLLDLIERAPEPAMHLDPGPIIASAQPTRRRRRAITIATGALAVLALAGTSVLTGWGPRALEAVPSGHSLESPARPSSPTATPTSNPTYESDESQTWGAVHLMSQQRNRAGGRPVLYLTRSRMLCIGTVDTLGEVAPSVCRRADAPPSNAFGPGYAWSMEGDLPDGARANEFIAGAVASDVTKVVVRTELGDLTAHLSPAPDPKLGQLYWVETRVPVLNSRTDAHKRSRVAYRGTKVAFTCGYHECLSG